MEYRLRTADFISLLSSENITDNRTSKILLPSYFACNCWLSLANCWLYLHSFVQLNDMYIELYSNFIMQYDFDLLFINYDQIRACWVVKHYVIAPRAKTAHAKNNYIKNIHNLKSNSVLFVQIKDFYKKLQLFLSK